MVIIPRFLSAANFIGPFSLRLLSADNLIGPFERQFVSTINQVGPFMRRLFSTGNLIGPFIRRLLSTGNLIGPYVRRLLSTGNLILESLDSRQQSNLYVRTRVGQSLFRSFALRSFALFKKSERAQKEQIALFVLFRSF